MLVVIISLRIPWDNHVLSLWDLQAKRSGRIFTPNNGQISGLAIANDGPIISISSGTHVNVWDLEKGEVVQQLLRNGEDTSGSGFYLIGVSPEFVVAIAITPDGRRAVAGFSNGIVCVWNINTGECIHSLNDHRDYVWVVTITPDEHFAAAGFSDGTVCVWNLQTEKLLHKLPAHREMVTALTISADQRYIISGSADATVKVWALQSSECLQSFSGHDGGISALAITSDNRYIVSGSFDRTIRIWDLQSGQLTHSPDNSHGPATVLAITGDGRYAVTGTTDSRSAQSILHLWDLQSKEKVTDLVGHTDEVTTVITTNDHRGAISGSSNGILHMWNLQNGKTLHILTNPVPEEPRKQNRLRSNLPPRLQHRVSLRQWVRALALTPDDTIAITGTGDGSIFKWNLQTEKLVGLIRALDRIPMSAATVTSNGLYLICGFEDGTLFIQDLQARQNVRTLQQGYERYWQYAEASTPRGTQLVRHGVAPYGMNRQITALAGIVNLVM